MPFHMPFAARVILCACVFIGTWMIFNVLLQAFLPWGTPIQPISLPLAIAAVAVVWRGSGAAKPGILMTAAMWAAIGGTAGVFWGLFTELWLAAFLGPLGLIVGGIGGLIYGVHRSMAASSRWEPPHSESDLDDDIYKIEGSGDGYSYTITRKSDGALMVKNIPNLKNALQVRRGLHAN